MTELPPHDPLKRFVGGAMIAVGGLMFGLCGLCTLAFFIGGLLAHQDKSFSVIALVVGGIPALIGFGLMRWGLSIHRGGSGVRPPPSAPPPG